MSKTMNRRTFLAATGAAGAGVYFGALPLRYARGAGKITIGTEAGSPYDTFYRKHAAEFTTKTGVEVAFNAIPHDNIRQQFVQDALSGAGGFDVYIADQVWLPEFYEKGFISDISGQLSDADKADFSKTAIETVSYKGAIVALPIMVHNCAMYYRTDLLDAAGIKAPPKTWDEYRQFAKATTKDGVWGTHDPVEAGHRGRDPPAMPSTSRPAATSSTPPASRRIDTDAGHAALEFMTEMVFTDKAAPRGVLELSDMQGVWLDGKLALAAGLAVPLLAVEGPARRRQGHDRHRAGQSQPGGTVYSWGFCAAAGSKNPEAAVEWVKWSTEHRHARTPSARTWINPVPRASAIEKITGRHEHRRQRQGGDRRVRRIGRRRKVHDMVPQYSQLLDVLGIMQSGVMSKAMSLDDALKDGQARAEEIMKG